MKKLILLMLAAVILAISTAGCYWGVAYDSRNGGYRDGGEGGGGGERHGGDMDRH